MSKNEKVAVSSTGAVKAGNLERFDLVPVEALREIAEHFGKGALKYEDRNWEKGMQWGKLYAALMRHLTSFWAGEDYDICKCSPVVEELPCGGCGATGSKHITAVAWHALALSTYMDDHRELDDRPSTLAKPRFAEGGPITWSPKTAVSVIKGGDNPTMDKSPWIFSTSRGLPYEDDPSLYPSEYYVGLLSTDKPVGTVKSGVISTKVTKDRLTVWDNHWEWTCAHGVYQWRTQSGRRGWFWRFKNETQWYWSGENDTNRTTFPNGPFTRGDAV